MTIRYTNSLSISISTTAHNLRLKYKRDWPSIPYACSSVENVNIIICIDCNTSDLTERQVIFMLNPRPVFDSLNTWKLTLTKLLDEEQKTIKDIGRPNYMSGLRHLSKLLVCVWCVMVYHCLHDTHHHHKERAPSWSAAVSTVHDPEPVAKLTPSRCWAAAKSCSIVRSQVRRGRLGGRFQLHGSPEIMNRRARVWSIACHCSLVSFWTVYISCRCGFSKTYVICLPKWTDGAMPQSTSWSAFSVAVPSVWNSLSDYLHKPTLGLTVLGVS